MEQETNADQADIKTTGHPPTSDELSQTHEAEPPQEQLKPEEWVEFVDRLAELSIKDSGSVGTSVIGDIFSNTDRFAQNQRHVAQVAALTRVTTKYVDKIHPEILAIYNEELHKLLNPDS